MDTKNIVLTRPGIFYVRFEGYTDDLSGLSSFVSFVKSQPEPISMVADLVKQENYSTEIRKAWVDAMMKHHKSVKTFYILGAKPLQRLAAAPVAVFISVEFLNSIDQVPGWTAA